MEWLLAVPSASVDELAGNGLEEPLQYYHTGQKAVGSDDPSSTNPRYDVEAADSEMEGANDMARFRYQRMFWENIAEGEVRSVINYIALT